MISLLLSNSDLIVEIILSLWGAIITFKWRKLSKQSKEQLLQLQILSSKRLSPFTRRQIKQAKKLKVDKLVNQLEKLNIEGEMKRKTVLAHVAMKNPSIGIAVIDEAIRIAQGK